jgi:hypothetical protein
MTQANVLTASSNQQIEIRQIWKFGPLRRWSPTKTAQTALGYSVGFVGSYVCARCSEPSDGVYKLREAKEWVCGPCRRELETSGGARQ